MVSDNVISNNLESVLPNHVRYSPNTLMCKCSQTTKKVCSGIWAFIAILALAVGTVALLTYFGLVVLPPGGCLSGCQNLGKSTYSFPPKPTDNNPVVVNGSIIPDTWIYYDLEVDTEANSLSVIGEVLEGEICLGYGRQFRPSTCDLPSYNSAPGVPVFCIHPRRMIIGAYLPPSNTSHSVEPQQFTFKIHLQNPNDDSGLVCLPEIISTWAVVGTMYLIAVIAFIWMTLCWCLKRCSHEDSEETEGLIQYETHNY